MEYSVDRLTALYAVCIASNGEKRLVPRGLINGNVAEGDVLLETNGRYAADPALTEARRAALFALAESLFDA